jgi:hypothetical protein
LDVGVLVLWWTQPRAAPPAFAGNWGGFTTSFAQALRRGIVTTSLQDLSRTDPLTGLDNRRVLRQALRSLAPGGGLLMVDLDHVKQVNDTLGRGPLVHAPDVAGSVDELVRTGPRVVVPPRRLMMPLSPAPPSATAPGLDRGDASRGVPHRGSARELGSSRMEVVKIAPRALVAREAVVLDRTTSDSSPWASVVLRGG